MAAAGDRTGRTPQTSSEAGAGIGGSVHARSLPLVDASTTDLRTEIPPEARWHAALELVYPTLPAGAVTMWGLPFELPAASADRRWLWLGQGASSTAEMQVAGTASHLVVAHFSVPPHDSIDDTHPDGSPTGVVARPGEALAEYSILYEDGTLHRQPIRRRFEVNDVFVRYGQLAFTARPHRSPRARTWRGPHEPGKWGMDQTGQELPSYSSMNGGLPSLASIIGNYWLWTFRNPMPDRVISRLRLEASGTGLLAVAGVTLFQGTADPLLHAPLQPLLIEHLSDDKPGVAVDLGLIATSTEVAADTDGEPGTPGWGAPVPPAVSSHRSIVEVAAAVDARIQVGDWTVDLRDVRAQGTLTDAGKGARITALPRADRVVEVTVVDAATGQPMPSRVRFMADDGRYLPPVGHRHDVNANWFEDVGSDLRLGSRSYAYVDGRFQILLPQTDVAIEVARGFEYTPLTTTIRVDAGLEELRLELDRPHAAPHGWVSADTHVHFISPDSAGLQGAGEGLDVVNILAAQLGDLYANVADFGGAANADDSVRHRGVIVRVGTENRQHMLGHLTMLGIGKLPLRLSAAGPPETMMGEPAWTSLAAWADESREQGGLVLAPHFPAPHGEVTADIILGKFDGVELRDFGWGIDSWGVREWYRLLNCGSRVAAVGGTDKMSAGMPVGGVRTYAYVGEAELTFDSWMAAVRAGRTTTSSGPLIDMSVDGNPIGATVALSDGPGTFEVEAVATSTHPLEMLEIVHNGEVVARTTGGGGPVRLRLHERLTLNSGWVAARCQGPGIAWHEWPVRMAAHTSPVYLGDAPPAPAQADIIHLSNLLDGGIAWLETLATRGSDESIDRIRSVFRQAQTELGRRWS